MNLEGKVYTKNEAAVYCGLSVEAFRYYIRKGIISPDTESLGITLRSGKGQVMFFRKATLDKFLKIPRKVPGYPKGRRWKETDPRREQKRFLCEDHPPRWNPKKTTAK